MSNNFGFFNICTVNIITVSVMYAVNIFNQSVAHFFLSFFIINFLPREVLILNHFS